MRKQKQDVATAKIDTLSERVDPFENVSDEAAESIAEQANDLGPEGGVIVLPEGVREDQVEPILDALAEGDAAAAGHEIADGTKAAAQCDPNFAGVEILSPVLYLHARFEVGAKVLVPNAIAERLIEGGSARRIE